MVRGFYTAGSGLVTQEKKLNNIGHNMANVTTVGFKKDSLISGTFGEHMSVRMNAYQREGTVDIGPAVFMQTITDQYTDHTQGSFDTTGRPMDLAIMGDGFFVVADDEGNEFLTRDGQFSIDAEGFLVLPGYGRVQGIDGDIEVGGSEFYVGSTGTIVRPILDGEPNEVEEIGQLAIALPEDINLLAKAPTGLFIDDGYPRAEPGPTDEFTIRQGILEKSNVYLAQEMTEMIAAQRQFQSCSQILRMYDQLTEQSYSRISRITQ